MLDTAIYIGPHRIDNPLALAPMAGVTDRAFRQLCARLGAGYVVTEMLSCNPALRQSKKSLSRGNFEGEPGPVAVQIAGGDPGWMADAADYNEQRGAQIIDINMGCPARKVCRKAAGSALMSNPALVTSILTAVTRRVSVPVTLKMRTGPHAQHRNAVEIAQIAEDCGIAALAVHGRTRADRFSGQAEYDTIAQVCRAVSIPVFANGDIRTPADAASVLRHTGANGLMIGRAAQGNPWIFREIRYFLDTESHYPAASSSERFQVLQAHLKALHRDYGEYAGVRIARKHLSWYFKGLAGAGIRGLERYRQSLMRAESAMEQLNLIAAAGAAV